MNLPNRLTVFRIMLVPFVVLFLNFNEFIYGYLCALLVFIVASLTDKLDGHIARKRNIITDFGKMMDPLADKILVTSSFICFACNGEASCIAVILIIAREFIVTSVRMLILKNEGKIISANLWGKLKTVSQMIAITVILTFASFRQLSCTLLALNLEMLIQNVLVWLSAALSLISGAIYIIQNRELIKSNRLYG